MLTRGRMMPPHMQSAKTAIPDEHTIEDLPVIVGGTPLRPRERFLVFGAPVLGEEELAGIEDCLRRRWIGTGPRVAAFEHAFAEFKQAPHAIAVNSGTAAMHLAMLANDIGPGDEVITSTMTFCSTVNSIGHAGAAPILVDCDRQTFNITADRIAERITERTKAVLVVHVCGRCCDMDPIVKLCRDRGLLIIEDCAHAIEAHYHGIPAGLIGDVGCFSFYATKNLTTGEGGMVLTRDADVAAEVKTLANHGMSANAWHRYGDTGYRHYTVERAGYKYNMPDINASIGLVQLSKLEERAKRRAEIWAQYTETLADLPCQLPPPEEADTRHARHLYTPLLELENLSATRDEILDAMTAENIGVGVHYLPVHQHPHYRDRWNSDTFENADWIGERTMSLPLTGELTEEDVEHTCRAFRRVLTHFYRPR